MGLFEGVFESGGLEKKDGVIPLAFALEGGLHSIKKAPKPLGPIGRPIQRASIAKQHPILYTRTQAVLGRPLQAIDRLLKPLRLPRVARLRKTRLPKAA